MSISYQEWGNTDSQLQILFIHGWGMNSGVWIDIAQYLEQLYPQRLIRAVDLPGYGQSSISAVDELDGDYNSQTLARSLEPLLEAKQTIIIAWSMGGLVAIELLGLKSPKIEKLILVSSTPCFVQTEDWPYAVEAQIFADFRQSLIIDHQATLKRFLAIQALGSRTAREDIKILQTHLLQRGESEPRALEQGLQILIKEDKRQQLQEITDVPIILIAGKHDTLAKYQGQKAIARQDNISLYAIPFAGHAPFISHPEEFKQILQKVI